MSNFALEINDLVKVYPNHFKALNGINFCVDKGDFFALLGPNGAGKSTTIGIISSLLKKTEGKIYIFGHDLDKNPLTVKKLLGIVPQEFNCNIFETPEQILLNQAGFYGISRKKADAQVKYYLQALGLWNKRLEPSGKLSGGMKRRLLIARALVHEPALLILDEPTAGVDIELRRQMWEFLTTLNQNGTTIILTTHYLEEAEILCKNIAIIDQGHLIANASTKNLLKKLNTETFIFYLSEALQHAPELDHFPCKLSDELSLEIEISHQQSLNELFSQLDKHGIKILSMRNKTNRLEELFLKLLRKNGKNLPVQELSK